MLQRESRGFLPASFVCLFLVCSGFLCLFVFHTSFTPSHRVVTRFKMAPGKSESDEARAPTSGH